MRAYATRSSGLNQQQDSRGQIHMYATVQRPLDQGGRPSRKICTRSLPASKSATGCSRVQPACVCRMSPSRSTPATWQHVAPLRVSSAHAWQTPMRPMQHRVHHCYLRHHCCDAIHKGGWQARLELHSPRGRVRYADPQEARAPQSCAGVLSSTCAHALHSSLSNSGIPASAATNASISYRPGGCCR